MRTLVKRISLQSTICRMVPAGDHRENRPPLRITIFVVRSSVLQVFFRLYSWPLVQGSSNLPLPSAFRIKRQARP
jgi:hypothetical protein